MKTMSNLKMACRAGKNHQPGHGLNVYHLNEMQMFLFYRNVAFPHNFTTTYFLFTVTFVENSLKCLFLSLLPHFCSSDF